MSGRAPAERVPGAVEDRPPLVHRAADRLADNLDRHRFAIVSVLTAIQLATAIVLARATPFWHDEIYTILLSQLPSLETIWTARLAAVDLAPPLHGVLVRLVHSMAGIGHVATRLPSIGAYLTASLVLFELVRRRSNTIAGLTAMFVLFFSGAWPFSYEARGYALMLALFALSLFAWSEAARGRLRRVYLPMLAVTIGASLWNHYFAILTVVPLLAGEAARLARTRRTDGGMAAALVASGVIALPLAPLMAVARRQAPTFWQRADVRDLVVAYRFLSGRLLDARFLVVYSVVALAVVYDHTGRGRRPGTPAKLPSHEIAAGLATLLIPVCGMALAVAVTGVFVPRYLVSAAIGLGLVIPLAVWRISPRGGFAPLVLCAGLAGAFAVSTSHTLVERRPIFRDPVRSRPALAALLDEGPPVIVTGERYLQIWYYATAGPRSRLAYLADPSAELRATGSDTLDRAYLALNERALVGVQDYRRFVATHVTFRVYAEEETDWLLRQLREDGFVVTPIGQETNAFIFDVLARQ